MATLEIPEKNQAIEKDVKIPVSTKVGGEKKATEFEAKLPASLEDAIGIYGKEEVFKRFINSMVISLQGEQRTKLQGGEEGSRVKAKYLDVLGL